MRPIIERRETATVGSLNLQADQKPTESEVYERIWAAIAERRLPPGTRLKEERLCELFGISRPRVRRALDALGHDGLVTHIPNRGAFVAKPTLEEARDVFFARRVIERGVLEGLVQVMKPEFATRLREHVETERQAADGGDLAATIRLSGRFHMLLAEIGPSIILAETLRDLVSRSTLVTAVFQPKNAPQCGPDEHEAIVAALEAGNLTDALREMENHLLEAEAALHLDQVVMEPAGETDVLSEALGGATA